MAEEHIRPEDVSPEDARKVLDFLNAAKTAEEIAEAVELPDERDVGVSPNPPKDGLGDSP